MNEVGHRDEHEAEAPRELVHRPFGICIARMRRRDHRHPPGAFQQQRLRVDGHQEILALRARLLKDRDELEAALATQLDALAIAIGTSHGAYKFSRKPTGDILAISRIKEIHARIPNTHLVMHGSSSVPQEWLQIINEFGGDLGETYGVLVEEIVDRFGKLPPQAVTLMDVHRLRVLAKPYGVVKIDAGPKLMGITFRPNPPVDAAKIIALVQKHRSIRLAGNDKLRIEREMADPIDRAQFVRDILRSLGTPLPQTNG